ncbi:MAG: transposase, partial [Bacteroidota bacterium]
IRGKQLGIVEGKQLGIVEGKQEGMLQAAKNLLHQGVEMGIISLATGLQHEQLMQLNDGLR